MAFHLKRNDTAPSIAVRPISGGKRVDADLIASAVFNMRGPKVPCGSSGALKINRGLVTVEDGVLIHHWLPTDVDESGEFEAEFEVTFTSGQVGTFPNEGFIAISIEDDLA